MLLPSADLLKAELCADSLKDFIPETWPLAETRPFKSNWHIDVIAEHLEAVSRGEILRLIINIPPRHMKSLGVGVFWPTWEWLRRPETQFMFGSYAQRLTTRDSLKCRRIIEYMGGQREGTLIQRVGYQGLLELLHSEWELLADQREKMKFENTEFGYRLATSIGGTGTGEGGDILVVDDPHKADEVESEVERENVIDWFDGTLSTRLNDPTTGRVVLVMQRLHELDATGHLLEQGGWTHLCLPAEYEPEHPFVWPDDPRTKPGELLWPEHFNKAALDGLKKSLKHRSAGQLQQRPAPAEGIMFKRSDFRYYRIGPDGYELGDEHRAVPLGEVTRFQTLDAAASDKTTADYTVVSTWVASRHRELILIDVERQQFESLDVPGFVQRVNEKHGRPPIWIETLGAGRAIWKHLQRLSFHALALKPEQGIQLDKIARAFSAIAAYQDHKIFHPVDAPWLEPFERELTTFPNAAHDDQVDTVSYAARLLPVLSVDEQVREPSYRPLSAGIMKERF